MQLLPDRIASGDLYTTAVLLQNWGPLVVETRSYLVYVYCAAVWASQWPRDSFYFRKPPLAGTGANFARTDSLVTAKQSALCVSQGWQPHSAPFIRTTCCIIKPDRGCSTH